MKYNLMKPLILTTILLVATSIIFGQVYNLRTTSFAYKSKINDYQWSDWSNWESTDVLITIDMNKEKFTIFSNVTQIYNIATYEGQSTDQDGDDTYSYYCVNEDGLTCRVRLLKLNSQNGRLQLYVDFDDMKWTYNVHVND